MFAKDDNVIDELEKYDEDAKLREADKKLQKLNKDSVNILKFTSDNKYSAATFDDYTYALGAFEVLPIENADEVKGQVESFSSKGNRVLVLVRGKDGIKEMILDKKHPQALTCKICNKHQLLLHINYEIYPLH